MAKKHENVVKTRSYQGNVHYRHNTIHACALMAKMNMTDSVDKAEQQCSAQGDVKWEQTCSEKCHTPYTQQFHSQIVFPQKRKCVNNLYKNVPNPQDCICRRPDQRNVSCLRNGVPCTNQTQPLLCAKTDEPLKYYAA